MGKNKRWNQPTGPAPAAVPFPQPDQSVSPFVLPVGATQGEPIGPITDVGPDNWTLYCFPSEATRFYQEYKEACVRQGYSENLQVASGTSDGVFASFRPAADGSDIYLIVGDIWDAEGNKASVSEICGQRVSGYVFPFSPGKPNYGDKNYKVVDGVDVAEPGILQLIGQSSGVALVPGQPIDGGVARGIWIPVPE